MFWRHNAKMALILSARFLGLLLFRLHGRPFHRLVHGVLHFLAVLEQEECPRTELETGEAVVDERVPVVESDPTQMEIVMPLRKFVTRLMSSLLPISAMDR
jgi:hypothetical protein